MSLKGVYEQYFGKAATAPAAKAEKKADTAVADAEKTKAEAGAAAAETEKAEAGAEGEDEELNELLNQLTPEQLAQLAKDTATEMKESAAKTDDSEKLAEEYFSAGRIFARGFMAELNGAGETATQKFAKLLKGELEKK